MRRILIEHARRRGALKRGGGGGGGGQRVDLNGDDGDGILSGIATPCDQVDDVLALAEALARLSAEDPGVAELVKLHFFAGLTLDEAAAAVGISRATAYRRWAFARAWLHDALTGTDRPAVAE